MTIEDEKTRLRERARALRRDACTDDGGRAALHLRDNFAAAMADMRAPRPGAPGGLPDPGAAVAGYWAMGHEIGAEPLLAHLHGLGYRCALPVVKDAASPLVFRRWQPGMELEEGGHGTRQPGPESGEVTPQVVLCPLLAFDAEGYRLGRGGGHYDRTLQALRAAGPVLAVGLAFAAQRVDTVPHGAHDQRLDWAVTEETAIRI